MTNDQNNKIQKNTELSFYIDYQQDTKCDIILS
jgi:hypothetical protein